MDARVFEPVIIAAMLVAAVLFAKDAMADGPPRGAQSVETTAPATQPS